MEMVGNDSFPHQRMIGQVSKPLSAKISEILDIRTKYRISTQRTTVKNGNFVILLIINYSVSYDVDKAY